MSFPVQRPLVLASTSVYRRALLERLAIPFAVMAPQVDETALDGEAAEQTALRLAEAKARAVALEHPGALIIGSDQVALLDGQALGKPGTHERATQQLRAMSGRSVWFHTGLCLLDARSGMAQTALDSTEVRFRTLSAELIDWYLRTEQPYDCAGSAKSEGLGIILIERMNGRDPSSLIGLPLMLLVDMLNRVQP